MEGLLLPRRYLVFKGEWCLEGHILCANTRDHAESLWPCAWSRSIRVQLEFLHGLHACINHCESTAWACWMHVRMISSVILEIDFLMK